MRLELRDQKLYCSKCLGYGVLNISKVPAVMEVCPQCGSVHAETLGLKYPSDADKTVFHKFMYVKKNRFLFF